VLHHKLFDRGAFLVGPDGIILVSNEAHGTTRFEEHLLMHHRQPVRTPQRPDWFPNPSFLEWHADQVFQGVARTTETPHA
jgi:putative restriction endonuclease